MSAPPSSSPARLGAEATGGGTVVGLLFAFFIGLIPDDKPYKQLLLSLSPALTGAVSGLILWMRTRAIRSAEDVYIASTALASRKELNDKLKEPDLSDDEKLEIIKAIRRVRQMEMEALDIKLGVAETILEQRKGQK